MTASARALRQGNVVVDGADLIGVTDYRNHGIAEFHDRAGDDRNMGLGAIAQSVTIEVEEDFEDQGLGRACTGRRGSQACRLGQAFLLLDLSHRGFEAPLTGRDIIELETFFRFLQPTVVGDLRVRHFDRIQLPGALVVQDRQLASGDRRIVQGVDTKVAGA